MPGSTFHYCGCRDAAGKQLGRACPQLTNSRHRRYGYVRRISTTTAAAWQLYRRGFTTKAAATAGLDEVEALLRLAGDDARVRARIGDLIREKTRRVNGGQLPTPEEVRLRLGGGGRLDEAQTVAEYLEVWLAGKRKVRPSTRHSYDDHLHRIWIPELGDIPLERLGQEHVERVVGKLLAQKTTRAAKTLSPASVTRYVATLRSALGAAVPRRIPSNPAAGIEIDEHDRHQVDPWTPAEAVAFLDACQGERLLALYELVVVEGLRRGEVCGLRWVDVDAAAGVLSVRGNRVEVNGRVVEGRAKTRSGERRLAIGRRSLDVLAGWRMRQQLEAAEWGAGWMDSGYVFTTEDGLPLRPDYVTRRFKKLAVDAGLRIIRFHDLRHTAASLSLAAGNDRTVLSKRLGHASTRITDDLYTHLYDAVGQAASDASAALLRKAPPAPP